VSSFFELYATVMGLVFVATVLWAPQGVVGLVARLRARAAATGR
jgi:ABC-type branched-subunit amino acid transport system permease subunit